jgi:hypothetical protein
MVQNDAEPDMDMKLWLKTNQKVSLKQIMLFFTSTFFAQIAEANAFTQLIEEKLDPAWKYLLWIDTKNHLEFTRLA